VLESCAAFLNAPMIAVLMAADIVKVEYFVHGTHEKVLGELSRALDFIAADPTYGAMLPDVRSMDLRTKFYVVFAYEKATGKSLLDSKVDIQAISKQLSG
jgi:hypothetical protein